MLFMIVTFLIVHYMNMVAKEQLKRSFNTVPAINTIAYLSDIWPQINFDLKSACP